VFGALLERIANHLNSKEKVLVGGMGAGRMDFVFSKFSEFYGYDASERLLVQGGRTSFKEFKPLLKDHIKQETLESFRCVT
jgi:hypothetical protein